MNVLVVGRGKVGRAIRARLAAPHGVRLVASRGRSPRIDAEVDLVVLAVRDDALPELAGRLAAAHRHPLRAAVVHVAGARGPEVLAALTGHCAGVGRAHPLVSFASGRAVPDLRGALWLVEGERAAVARARRLVRALGGVPRSWPGVPPAAYHAAAALTANGAVALAAAAARVLVDAGAPAREVAPALGVLLRSVAENVTRLGLPGALTGPIRRGDADTVARHRAALARQPAEIKELYRAAATAQLWLAEALGEASVTRLRAVRRALRRSRRA